MVVERPIRAWEFWYAKDGPWHRDMRAREPREETSADYPILRACPSGRNWLRFQSVDATHTGPSREAADVPSDAKSDLFPRSSPKSSGNEPLAAASFAI